LVSKSSCRQRLYIPLVGECQMTVHVSTTNRYDFVTLLFGKPFGALTCRDVREKLATVHESSSIEFKETFESEKELKEAILKNVVAFLNTSEGRGLLILGIKDVRKERYEKKITGVPKDLVE